jgi:hypothetical protein
LADGDNGDFIMLVMELLKKLFEIILGDFSKIIINRGINPKRKFARTIFWYYETILEYKQLCIESIKIITHERELVPSKRITPGTARKLQQRANKMAILVRDMIEIFERRTELLGKSINKVNLIQLFDPKLARLMSEAIGIDMKISYVVSEYTQTNIDWNTQQISVITSCNELRKLSFSEPQDYDDFRTMLKNAILTIDKLASQIRIFMKSNFNIDDLL